LVEAAIGGLFLGWCALLFLLAVGLFGSLFLSLLRISLCQAPLFFLFFLVAFGSAML